MKIWIQKNQYDIIKEASLLETEALSLVNSSNILVTKLGEYVRSNSENLLFNQKYL